MDPGAIVKQAVERVLEITADTSIDAKVRRNRIRAVINDHFDFATMSPEHIVQKPAAGDRG